MKIITKFTFLLITVVLFNCSPKKEKLLQLSGEVVNTDTKSILLMELNQDLRVDSLIEIPVENGKFYYEVKLEHPKVVNLVLGNSRETDSYTPMPVFLENEEINLTIYPEEEFDKNIVQGGKLNDDFLKFQQSFDSTFKKRIEPLEDSRSVLIQNNEYTSDQVNLLFKEVRNSKNQEEKLIIYQKIEGLKEAGQFLSPRAKKLEEKLKPIYDEQKKFRHEYIKNNPTTVSYFFLLDELIWNEETLDIQSVKSSFEILSKTNPNHPYNALASNLIHAIENIKVGKKYVDFSAPDLNGKEVKLSDKIKGKISLLNLWATWCGPCIAKSRTMAPLYEEFKDKNFTVVGVAGEFGTTERLMKFSEKKEWGWLNLVELDRENHVWQKYGVDGSGGGMFLIDEEGIILAKDPTAEEVRKELESRIN